MRGLVYGIAVIAAAGIMFAIAKVDGPVADGPVADGPVADDQLIGDPSMKESGALTLAVPEMHCSFSCFPRVKKNLESNDAVDRVELGPQRVKDAIDNRQVIVHYQAGFDVAGAIKRLGEEGFTESQIVP